MALVRNDGRAFEDFVVKYHAEKYDHTVWHGTLIPEDELIRSEYVNDYNRFRLIRIARRREENEQFPLFLDYGMDFLALDRETGLYYAGQCKNYTNKIVTAYDIATFVLMAMARFGRGFLYTTSDLQPVVREDIAFAASRNRFHLIHHRLSLDFAGEGLAAQMRNLEVSEKDRELRPCQVEMIAAAIGPGKKIIKAPCAFGKTLCLGHILRASTDCKLIFCVAPLRAHVDNLVTRLTPFLTDCDCLLVDSDAAGTTDLDVIKEFLKTSGKPRKILFTTFHSMDHLLIELATGFSDQYLIVDEAHNLVHREMLCDIANLFENALFLSGTMPEEFEDCIEDADIAYSYTIADGIREGYICDYEIILPLLAPDEDGVAPHVDITLPQILTGNPADDKNVTARKKKQAEDLTELLMKAFFLVSSMLKYGKRRCIVYLRSENECELFEKLFLRVCEEYHAIRGWCESIHHGVNAPKRRSILNEFQNGTTHGLYILTSIFILDEAIDVPKCDSEFITSVAKNPSETRTVQRLMRGARLDPSNPSKKNHLFIWATDEDSVVSALTYLREEDLSYHKKIHIRSGNYENATSPDILRREAAAQIIIREVVQVKSKSYMDIWEEKRLYWVAQYNKYGRKPYASSKDEDEKRAAKWQNTIRGSKRRKTRYRLTEEQIQRLNNTPGWTWEDDKFSIQRANWIDQYKKKNNKKPSRCTTDPDEKASAIWQDMIRQIKKGLRKSAITEEQLATMDHVEGWIWEEPMSFNKQLNHWVAQYQKLNAEPSITSEDKDEKNAAIWQKAMRDTKNGQGKRVLTDEYKAVLDRTPGWEW